MIDKGYEPVLEAVEIAYEALLREKLPAALDYVEADWAAKLLPVDLPDVPDGNWTTGEIPDDVVFNFVKSWPYVIIEAIQATPDNGVANASQVELTVQCWIRGKTPSQANKLTKRYCQAIRAVIRTNKVQPIDAGIYEVRQLSIGVGETLSRPDGAYVKRCGIRAPLLMAVRL